MKIWRIALVLLGAAAPAGKQIVLHGNSNGAMPCAACHGINGLGNAAIGAPVLAGKPAAGIVSALGHLASGQGSGPMPGIARALSPQERQGVAAYFAGLPKP
ncbi:MAG: c-type cytochrome [Rhodospirillales bacterium]|nr:c-type cytochrome [Rhodospirillales bacterium]MDE2319586.1 c-type cytochrome [Rhodospirillales bacterium]